MVRFATAAGVVRCLFGRHLANYLGCDRLRPLIKEEEEEEEEEDSLIGDEGAETVMMRLGLWEYCSGEAEVDGGGGGGRCGLIEAVEEARRLLEEKEASLEEAEAAFGMFDGDGDGVIRGEELRSVMRRLGLEEGRELEDCRRMIEAYDEDGDGGICYAEFKKMMEMAV